MTIQSFHALLDEIWRSQIQPTPNNCGDFLTRLANDFATDETLIQAKSRYQSDSAAISSLISIGFLKEHNSGLSIGFAHQTYFEHALARLYSANPDSLSSYIRPRTRSLFIRPRLLTAISYLRESYGASSPSYVRPLTEIWRAANESPHLRHLLVEFIGSQQAPSAKEVSLLIDFAATGMEPLRLAVRHTAGSDGWFEEIRSNLLEEVMQQSPGEAAIALEALAKATHKAPDSVANLISRYWLTDSDYHRLSWLVLANTRGWSESLTSVAVDLAQRQSADCHLLDATTSLIAEEHPTAALQIIKAYISIVAARIQILLEKSSYSPGERVTFNLQQSIRKEFELLDNLAAVPELAAQHGKDFIDLLWPPFAELLTTIEVEGSFADRGFNSYGHDSISFSQRQTEDENHEGDDYSRSGASTALDSLVTAAVAFWEAEPTGFTDWLGKVEKIDSLLTQRMIALTFAAIGAPVAEYAGKFLCSDSRRLFLGLDTLNRTGTTALLIRAIGPHLAKHNILLLEGAVISTFPPPDTDEPAASRKALRETYDRASLLSAIGKNALSTEATDILQADEVAIGDVRSRSRGRSGWVGSPMTQSDMASSSNTDIVELFKQLPDSTEWENPDFEKRLNLQGGSIQASREFAAFARENHDRAALIVEQFNKGEQERPAGYAIAAMAGLPQDGPRDQHTPANPKQVIELIRKCVAKGFDHLEFRGSVADALGHLSTREVYIPEDMLALLEDWLSTPVPELEEEDNLEELEDVNQPIEKEDSREREREHKNGIIWDPHRFETLPGGNFQCLDTLSSILLSKAQRDFGRWLDILERHLNRQDDEKTWSSLLHFFEYVETDDRPRASEFIATLFDKYPALVLRPSTVLLLARTHWWLNPDLLRRLTENFGSSDSTFAKQAFGKLIGLFATVKPDSAPWAVERLNQLLGTSIDSQRPEWLGLALSAANLFGYQGFTERACCLLTKAIETHDKEVLDAAFEVFRVTDKLQIGNQTRSLLGAVEGAIRETATPDPIFLVEHLEKILPDDPALVANLCSTLVKRAGSELGNFSTSLASIAPNLVNIALTLHREEGEIGQKGLHLFEALLEVNAYGAKAALTEIDDRPVRAHSRPVRARKFHRPQRRRRRPA